MSPFIRPGDREEYKALLRRHDDYPDAHDDMRSLGVVVAVLICGGAFVGIAVAAWMLAGRVL